MKDNYTADQLRTAIDVLESIGKPTINVEREVAKLRAKLAAEFALHVPDLAGHDMISKAAVMELLRERHKLHTDDFELQNELAYLMAYFGNIESMTAPKCETCHGNKTISDMADRCPDTGEPNEIPCPDCVGGYNQPDMSGNVYIPRKLEACACVESDVVEDEDGDGQDVPGYGFARWLRKYNSAMAGHRGERASIERAFCTRLADALEHGDMGVQDD